jgi:hypothetical protein
MHWTATSVVAAGLWAASAQTLPPVITMPPATTNYVYMDWSKPLKDSRLESLHVCSIPLIEVPVAKTMKGMRILRPSEQVDRMPLIPLPAPPCEENKR